MTAVDDSPPPGVVAFDEVQRVLGLFADGLTGESMQLESTEDERVGWPWDASMPSGTAIRLPAAIADSGSTRANRGAYRAAVLHRVGFTQFGGQGFVDADLAAVLEQSSRPELLRDVFALFENLRIDAATRREYPGARGDLDRVRVAARAHRRELDAGDGLQAFVEVVRQRSLGAGRDELTAVAFDVGLVDEGLIEAVLAAGAPLVAAGATVHDSMRAAIDLCAVVDGEVVTYVDGARVMGEPDATDDSRSGGSDPGEESGGESDEADAPGSVDKDDHGADASELGGQATDVFAHERQPELDETELSRDGRTVTARLPPVTDADGARIYLYDEWDYLAGRHLPAWCRVVERRLSGEDYAFIGDVRRRYAVLASRLRRQFAHIRPEGWVRVHRSDDGDELDFDAVIEAIVDRRTGHAADERLHVRRDRAARDVATAFLVDLSASTGSAIPDPEEIAAAAAQAARAAELEQEYRFSGIDPWDLERPNELRRRVLDIAKESVAMMCDALALLGDRHAVYGFSGEGRGRVEFHVAKEFDDRTSPASWAALAAMQPRRYTRMGPAIRHAAAKLATQPTRTKLLIVISDGYPQDIDYGPNRGDKEYGLQDTARALQDAAAMGIATFCVTIDPAGHDYLRRMCPDQSYLVIDDVPSLPRELAKLYGTLAVPTTRRGGQIRPASAAASTALSPPR